jgi:hypothetical protein
VEEFKNT